jgi:hypothetical protein
LAVRYFSALHRTGIGLERQMLQQKQKAPGRVLFCADDKNQE